MPKGKVDLRGVNLDKTATRFLDTKKPSTRKAYGICLRRFYYFFSGGLAKFIGEIEDAIEQNEKRSLAERVRPGETTIRKFIGWHKEVDYSNNATRQSVAALQNALKYYGIILSFDFIELPPAIPKKVNDKHKWKLEEIRQFVNMAKYVRDKTIIIGQVQSGLGIGDIVALNYGDVRRELDEDTLPLMLHLYRQKTNVEHKTFFGADTVRYLKLCLESRKPLADDDPLFTKLGSNERVTEGAIQIALKRYAEKLPFLDPADITNGYNPARPHSLRAAFNSRLTGKMDRTLIEFFMGHSIGEEKRAYLEMPDEELRELYANYEHLLSIEKTSKQEQEEAGPLPLPEETIVRIEDLETTVKILINQNTGLEAEVAHYKAELTQRDDRLTQVEKQQAEILRELKALKV